MVKVNTREAKTHFSRLLRRVRSGEEIVIAAAGRPVARLVPIGPDTGPRVLGGDEGEVWVAEDFNAPLPDAIVATFYGAGAKKGRTKARSGHRARPRARTGERR
jgi:prevent-host-death family protein